ncbi:MAG: asparagine synthase-related protein, partial [Candidatus Thorarchaeota archaeon SMTZ1-45]
VVFEGEFLLNAMYEAVSKSMSQKDGGIVLLDGDGADTIMGHGRPLMELRFLTSPGILPLFELFNNFILRVFSKWDYKRYKVMIEGLKSKMYDSRFLLALFKCLPQAEYLQNFFEAMDLTSINEYEVQQMRKYKAPLIESVYRLQAFERELKRVNNARFQMARAQNILLFFPFADRNLFQFMLEVPIKQKVKEFTSKYLLKKALSRHVPRDLVHRSKTASVSGVVWQEIFGTKEFQSVINEIKAAHYPYFDFDLDSVFNRPELWGIALKLINFHLWHQVFIS